MVLPVKGGAAAKSRLGLGDHAEGLALAMASDCLATVLATPGVDSAVVVTADDATAQAARELGARVVRQRGNGLGAAISEGLHRLPGPVAVLLADLPCLRPQDLRAALDAVERTLAAGARAVFVPDADDGGTVLLAAASPTELLPRFGPGSAKAHELGGARRLALALPHLRRDVDTAADLRRALDLGVGERTAARLRPVQTTVLSYDAGTRTGTVVTDDGIELDLAPDALEGSGLRHLRPGQRVSCVQVDDGHVAVVRIHGVSG